MTRILAAATFGLALTGLLSACEPIGMAVGAGATVGTAAAEERGVGGAVDDVKIRAEINDLWFRHDVDMYGDVGLTVNEGRVLLTGKVKKPEHRVDAVRLAWQAPGVRQVIDEIEVTDQSSFSDYATDVRISTNLKTRLLFDKQISNINYTVDVVNASVYLMGVAQNQDELDRVIAHARDISGVRRVVSHVVLKDDPSRFQGKGN